MKTTLSLVLVALLALAIPAMADNPERIGVVSALQGSASAKNASGAVRPLAVRQSLYRNDVITTGANSRCVLLFADMTTFCLSANSTLRVQEYIAGRAAQFELQRGTFQMMSGDIARTNPTRFNLTTPTASIGIRGTTTGHTIGENSEQHFVLDMEPGHQVIIGNLRGGPPVIIDRDLISIEIDPQGGFGPGREMTPEQVQEFSGQFAIDNPLAYMPPPLDANGNPILPPLFDENGNPIAPPLFDANGNPITGMPPMLDENGNPIAPPPMFDAAGNPVTAPMYDANGNFIMPQGMYDAEGNLIAPPPGYSADGTMFPTADATMFATLEYAPMTVTYDANGNVVLVPLVYDADGTLLPPPPIYDADGNLLPPPPIYDADGNLLPPPPVYDADGNLITTTTDFMYDPTGSYIPPPDIFDPYAADFTGDQIVGGAGSTYTPTHLFSGLVLYKFDGTYCYPYPGGAFHTNAATVGQPFNYTGVDGGGITTDNTSGLGITGVTVTGGTPFTWSGYAPVYAVPMAQYTLPGTTDVYMTWGTWQTVDPNFVFTGTNGPLEASVGHWIDMIKTPDVNIAALGANNVIGYYAGAARGTYVASGSASALEINGSFNCEIDFNSNALTSVSLGFNVPSTWGLSGSGTVSPAGLISATLTGNMPGGTTSGQLRGACFGPNAEGVGGDWAASTGPGGSAAAGTFTGIR